MKLIHITFILLIFLSLSPALVNGQCGTAKFTSTTAYSIDVLEQKWAAYVNDPGFKNLLLAVSKQGFVRIANNNKAAWGFKGSYIPDSLNNNGVQPTEICAFDFYKKTATGGQMCSMVWRKVGGTVYRAYIIFPEGITDFAKAFEASTEFYADENNQIQKAQSFGKCWARCLRRDFKASNCVNAMISCGTAAATLTTLGIGVTTPIALGIFGSCAGVFCLLPLAICAAVCL